MQNEGLREEFDEQNIYTPAEDNQEYEDQADYIPYQPSKDVLANLRHVESLEAQSAVAFTMAQAFQQKIKREVSEINEEEDSQVKSAKQLEASPQRTKFE